MNSQYSKILAKGIQHIQKKKKFWTVSGVSVK